VTVTAAKQSKDLWWAVWLTLLLFVAVFACAPPAGATDVVVLVVDDAGPEWFGALYNEGNAPYDHPPTPHLDALASRAAVFSAAWGAPACSPARAMLFTGAYPFRTGMGEALRGGDPYSLPTGPWRALPLRQPGVLHVGLGKWHLGGGGAAPGCFHGFAEWEGLVGASQQTDWYAWTRARNWQCAAGPPIVEHTYAVPWLGDEALERLAAVQGGPVPWTLWLMSTAIHSPWQQPPGPWLWSYPASPERELAGRNLQALDHEVGRLVAALDFTRTLLVLCADNGSPKPLGGRKGTVYEGGCRVPLVLVGPGVVPGRYDTPVSLVDLPATLRHLALGGGPPWRERVLLGDGRSLLPLVSGGAPPDRAFVLTERFQPNGLSGPKALHQRAARDDQGYKLHRDVLTGQEQFFLLPDETTEVPKQGPHYAALRAYLDSLPVF
jgi:arylsulfatase A-like enzyme